MVVPNIPEHLKRAKLRGKHKIPCLICGPDRILKLQEMRSHVAIHILRAKRGASEEGLVYAPGPDPCGFCGLDGCLTQLEIDDKRKKNPIITKSNCVYHYSGMNYKSAKKSTRSALLTNVPIYCQLCPPSETSGERRTIWKYNAISHIIDEHAFPEGKMPLIRPEFMAEFYIQKAEEVAMGILAEDTVAVWV
ncbi:hypothetical protein DFH06DRAFT_1006583 [Mycena polygramma]|nr:hypothetical protein DFH06DRAFT_1006583 [Mycena polygramma]